MRPLLRPSLPPITSLEVRESLGLSQDGLAILLGMDKSRVAKIETGINNPSRLFQLRLWLVLYEAEGKLKTITTTPVREM